MVSVVILTYNEELNLGYALKSVKDCSDDIHIVDSGSNDRTIEIAKAFNANIHVNPWTNWAEQRNWALDNCQLKHKWVLFLDADEQITKAGSKEINQKIITADNDCLGFYLKFDFYFLGRKVRNAMSPHLRMVRHEKVRWKNVGAREYCNAPSDSPAIISKFIHYDHRPLSFWVNKQLRNAKLEAKEKYAKRKKRRNQHSSNGDHEMGAAHKIKMYMDVKGPLFLSPFFFLPYRLFFNMSLHNFFTCFFYAFLFGFWYPMMIDVEYIKIYLDEKKNKQQ